MPRVTVVLKDRPGDTVPVREAFQPEHPWLLLGHVHGVATDYIVHINDEDGEIRVVRFTSGQTRMRLPVVWRESFDRRDHEHGFDVLRACVDRAQAEVIAEILS